jgi:hydrogenase assembly chaperone HypC/HupF
MIYQNGRMKIIMCIAAPGKVIKIQNKKAFIQYPGNQVRQAIVANEKIKVGSYVLVQMGIIIEILPSSRAKQVAKAWDCCDK